MSKIRAVPFRVAHMDLIDLREREIEVFNKSGNINQRLAYLETTHNAETLIYNGIVLGVIGFIEVLPNVLEVFLFPSTHIKDNTVAFARLMKYYKEEAITHYTWHRLQIVTPNDELHRRWATFLGFEEEGILRKFDFNGEDHVMWSVVR